MVDYSVIIQKIFGTGTQITGIRPVFGGDINEAYLLLLSDGNRVFLKENTKGNVGFFETEKACLSAIRSTGTIRVPEVLETGICENQSYLVMEYLEAAPEKKDFWECFGRQLAAMHRADPSEWTPGGIALWWNRGLANSLLSSVS